MARKLSQIIACLTDDGDIFSVLNFVSLAPGSQEDAFQTDAGRHVQRLSATEFYLPHTGQKLVAIRRGRDNTGTFM